MRLWRLEFGTWSWSHPGHTWRDWLVIEYDPASCHCKICTIGCFFFTWLGHECMEPIYLKKAKRARTLGRLAHRKDRQKERQKRLKEFSELIKNIDESDTKRSAE